MRWERAWCDALGGHGDLAQVVVANRTVGRASTLAARVGGTGVGLAGLGDALASADVVFVSTGAALPVLDAELLGPAARGARAPRRAVHRSWSSTSGCRAMSTRPWPASPASICSTWTTSPNTPSGPWRDAGPSCRPPRRSWRRKSSGTGPRSGPGERLRWSRPCGPVSRSCAAPSCERHRGRLAELDERQWHEVDSVVRDVLAKLLHQPTVAVKEAAGTPRGERLVEALRTLFDL